MNRNTLALVISLCCAGTASAADTLGESEVRALVSGKTFDIHNLETDKRLTAYSRADGTHNVYIPWKDKVSKRTWWMEGDLHCTSHPKRGNLCKEIQSAGDGVFHGFVDGKHTHVLSNFREGNQL